MAQTLGAQNARVSFARDLLTRKGRDEHRSFAFEGTTLLDEALRSGVAIRELYVTADAYETAPLVRELESRGVPTYVVGDRTFAKISDVETPTGVLAIADLRLGSLEDIFAARGCTPVLADLADPGNVGTLLRSAEAFGTAGVVVGSLGVDPHHPKVVRSAMGALFRLKIAVADPDDLLAAAGSAGAEIVGLSAGGDPIASFEWGERTALVVGHERHGLGRWEAACGRRLAIPMAGPSESLNAAVAGSIAMYLRSQR
jgi:TrmH family RNA methyltransferase